MKKLLLAGALAIAGLVSAQKSGLQGTWFATAQLGYQSNGASGNAKVSTTTIIPIVGTFVSPNVAIGLGGGVVSTKTGSQSAVNTTVLEPLVRKYWNVAGSLYFYGQGAVPILIGDNQTTYGVTLTPGFDYVLTKWFTVELSATVAGLQFTSVKGGNTAVNFGINPMAHSSLGTSTQVGFKFLF